MPGEPRGEPEVAQRRAEGGRRRAEECRGRAGGVQESSQKYIEKEGLGVFRCPESRREPGESRGEQEECPDARDLTKN